MVTVNLGVFADDLAHASGADRGIPGPGVREGLLPCNIYAYRDHLDSVLFFKIDF